MTKACRRPRYRAIKLHRNIFKLHYKVNNGAYCEEIFMKASLSDKTDREVINYFKDLVKFRNECMPNRHYQHYIKVEREYEIVLKTTRKYKFIRLY